MDSTCAELSQIVRGWGLTVSAAMSQRITAEGIEGRDIYDLLEDGKESELEGLFGITVAQRVVVTGRFRTAFRNDFNRNNVPHNPLRNEGVQNNNDLLLDEFFPWVHLAQRTRRLDFKVKKTMKFVDFKKQLADRELAEYTRNNKAPELRMIVHGQEVHNDRTFEYYAVTSLDLITIITSVIGGALQPEKAKKQRVRRPNSFARILKGRITTEKKCCICDENDPKNKRVKSSCGCVFCAPTMYDFFTSQFDNYQNIHFKCPVCQKPIPWELLAAMAGLTPKEFAKYTNILREREKIDRNSKFKNCPHCKNLVDHPPNLDRSRVKCVLCNKSDWCFQCLLPWKSGGVQICGNQSCHSHSVIEIINNCPIVPQFGCPSIRGCPKCLSIIQYRKNCRHIQCPNKACKFDFCLVCLQDYKQHKNCFVAPRQTFN